MAVFRRLATSHIFERSTLAGHATPESQPRFVSPKKPAMLPRNRRGPARRSRRYRSDVREGAILDRNRNATPTDLHHRVAAADRDRTDAHVIIVDVPTFLTSIGRSATSEFGHTPMIPRILIDCVKPLRLGPRLPVRTFRDTAEIAAVRPPLSQGFFRKIASYLARPLAI